MTAAPRQSSELAVIIGSLQAACLKVGEAWVDLSAAAFMLDGARQRLARELAENLVDDSAAIGRLLADLEADTRGG
jgi:hypothetical protein